MKHCIFFPSLISLFTFLVFAQITPQEKPTIINLHNHINNPTAHSSTYNQTDTNQQTSSSAQTLSTTTIINDRDIAQKTTTDCYSSILAHPYKITAAIICISYAYIHYQLYSVYTLLQDPTSWSNWKSIASVHQLASTPNQELMPALFTDIQKKYLLSTKKISSHHTFSPLDQFIKDILYELKLLNQYLTIQKYVKMAHLSKIFYFPYQQSHIQEKINRLYIMLDIFISWQAKEFLKP